MLPFLPCQNFDSKCFNCEKWIIEWDCSSWLQNQEICLGHSTSKMGIRRGTGKTIKCFQDLCILTVKYFLPIYNISSGSLEKAPWFQSSPFLFVAWDLFHNSIKILLGLVHLKTSSGIEFKVCDCCWQKWEKYEKNLNLSAPGGPYTPWILGIHCKYLWKSIKHLIIMFLRGWVGTNITSFQVLSCAM